MNNNSRKELSKFIKIKRVELGLTQKQLAKKSEIATKSLSTIENSEKVRDETISKVLDCIGYELEVIETLTFTKKE